MVSDGAVVLTAVWFDDAWGLYLSQIASRGLSNLTMFGPAWAMRSVLNLSAPTFLTVAHVLYFCGPMVLWLLIRSVEPHAAFSRLFLATALVLVYFVTELTAGIGLWLAWLAVVVSPKRATRHIVLCTLGLGVAMVFTHPALLLMTVTYLVVGAALTVGGRPLPPRSFIAALALAVVLGAGYFATSRVLPPTNPTIVRALAGNAYDFVDPWWMLATIGRSPMLAVLWLLMLAPGANAAALRWRAQPAAIFLIGAIGLWFALNGVTQVTWLYARHTAIHVLVVAVTLALVAPSSVWLTAARHPLALFAAVVVAGALSYSVDLILLERYVGSRLTVGYIDAETLRDPPWPPPRSEPTVGRVVFKWTAGKDYVRDVVVPDYDWFISTLALTSFFMSDRTAVLFHRVSDAGWVPYECPAVRRVLQRPRDERDARFLRFLLDTGYCVP
jgi:hypothetical protein